MNMREQLDALIAAYRAEAIDVSDLISRLEDIVHVSDLDSVPTITESVETRRFASATLNENAPGPVDPTQTTEDLVKIMDQRQTFAERYEQSRQIGQGGAGQVFEATDLALERPVAIKVLKQQNQSSEERRRFVDEAKVTAQLQHPNIVPVYDFGVRSSHEPWFSMKRIFGLSLEEVISDLFSPQPSKKIRMFSP